MLKRILCILLISITLFLPAFAKNGPPPERPFTFIELWNTAAYYDTNLEEKRFASILVRYEGKIGLNLFNYPLQIYGVYYGVASQSDDYWNNSLLSGAGIRVMPFEGIAASGFFPDCLKGLKIYAEDLSASYFRNAASAEGLAKTDRRYGIEIFREWNLDNPDESRPWGELWLNLSHRETNFGWEEFEEYVLYFQPKFGIHLGDGIELYLRGDITSSGKKGPEYYFLNVADYGIGLRFEPWRKSEDPKDIFRKFKMFAEVLGVSYLKDEPTDINNKVDSDVRFGIEFSYGR